MRKLSSNDWAFESAVKNLAELGLLPDMLAHVVGAVMGDRAEFVRVRQVVQIDKNIYSKV